VTGPTFVPRPEGSSEDDGYLLVSVLDGRDGSTSAKPTTRLEILDALDLNKGPLCSVAIDTYMPHSLYGCWADGVVPAEDDYSKGSLRAAMQEKDWNSLGMGMSLIGIANFAD